MHTVTAAPATRPAYGSVEQIADVLRMNNPDRHLVESRTLAVIKVLAEGVEPAADRLRYVCNALAAEELVRGEMTEAGR